jgi:hypothetical protein
MKNAGWFLLLVLLSPAAARADTGACALVDAKNGPFRCSVPACGETYYTYQTEQCNISGPCDAMFPVSICCGRFDNFQDLGSGTCLFTEMRDKGFKAHIMELARENEILVPTCSGAYVPARVVFQQRDGANDGGL